MYGNNIEILLMTNSTKYNEAIIQKLKEFDYNSFLSNNNFSPEIFNEVSAYLSSGDVRGVYGEILFKMSSIKGKIENIKDTGSGYKLPDSDLLLNVSQEFSDLILFGQYVTRIFKQL